jgi:predicted transcriptional regulator
MVLTDNQLQVMNLFWNGEGALTSNDIIELSTQERNWQDISVFVIINALLKKGAIEEVAPKKGAKGKYIRQFVATVSRQEYFSQSALGKSDMTTLVSALIKNADMTPESIDTLEALLREKRSELK